MRPCGLKARSPVRKRPVCEIELSCVAGSQLADSKPSRFDHRVSAEQFGAKSANRSIEAPPRLPVIITPDPHQDQPGHGKFLPDHEIAEILVICQQKPPIASGPTNNVTVIRTRRDLEDINNVMAGFAKLADQPRRDALVDEPAHTCQPFTT